MRSANSLKSDEALLMLLSSTMEEAGFKVLDLFDAKSILSNELNCSCSKADTLILLLRFVFIRREHRLKHFRIFFQYTPINPIKDITASEPKMAYSTIESEALLLPSPFSPSVAVSTTKEALETTRRKYLPKSCDGDWMNVNSSCGWTSNNNCGGGGDMIRIRSFSLSLWKE